MRYRLRTLLIVLAAGPPLMAGIVFALRAIWASDDARGLVVGPLAIPLLILLVAPLWVPVAYLAYLIRQREFTVQSLIMFTLIEVASLCLCGLIADHLPD